MKIIIEDCTAKELRELFGRVDPAWVRPRRQAGPEILMARTAYDEGLRELTARPPEAAGMLIGPKDHPAVTHFILDGTGVGNAASFTFDHDRLNEVLGKYVPLGLDCKGFWHSHPDGCTRLSRGDLNYVRKLFLNPKNDVREVLMPIVSGGAVYPFVVYPDRAAEARLVIF